jgi:hypothetical protein
MQAPEGRTLERVDDLEHVVRLVGVGKQRTKGASGAKRLKPTDDHDSQI